MANFSHILNYKGYYLHFVHFYSTGSSRLKYYAIYILFAILIIVSGETLCKFQMNSIKYEFQIIPILTLTKIKVWRSLSLGNIGLKISSSPFLVSQCHGYRLQKVYSLDGSLLVKTCLHCKFNQAKSKGDPYRIFTRLLTQVWLDFLMRVICETKWNSIQSNISSIFYLQCQRDSLSIMLCSMGNFEETCWKYFARLILMIFI